MRRAIRVLLRAAVLALLAGAALDWKSPARAPARRAYVVDVSASVLARGRPDSLTPDDARRMIEADLRASRPSDLAAVFVVGRQVAVPIPRTPVASLAGPLKLPKVDATSTDLASALAAAASAAEGGDLVLFSDGRAPLEGAALRGVVVHAVPIGPESPVDARIVSVSAPPSAPRGTPFDLRVSIAATAAWSGTLAVRSPDRPDRLLPLTFEGAGVQDAVVSAYPGPEGPGPLHVNLRIEGATEDACPANDVAEALVWPRDTDPRIAVISRGTAEPWLGAPVMPPGSPLPGFDVLVLHSVAADVLGPETLRRIQREVQEGGAGLVLVGGPEGFAPGGWAGTPIEDLSPLWAHPDERSGVIVLLDASGSMNRTERDVRRLDLAADAVKRAASLAHADDELALIAFSSQESVMAPLKKGRDHVVGPLSRFSAGGSTQIAPAMRAALAQARVSSAGRKCIVLVTDGETLEPEEVLRSAAAEVARDGARLFIVQIGPTETAALKLIATEARGELLDASKPGDLDRAVAEAFSRSRDLYASPSTPAEGPGLAPLRVERMHRCATRPGAEIVARADTLPLLAIRPAGRGRVAAITTSPETGWLDPSAPWGDLLRAAIDRVTPAGGALAAATADLEGDELVLRVRTRQAGDSISVVLLEEGSPPEEVTLRRRAEDLFEARRPRPERPATLRIGGRIAATTPALPGPELQALGADLPALTALASSTGGSVVRSPSELRALPRRGPDAPRSLRLRLIAAALLLALADFAIGIFLKESRPNVRYS